MDKIYQPPRLDTEAYFCAVWEAFRRNTDNSREAYHIEMGIKSYANKTQCSCYEKTFNLARTVNSSQTSEDSQYRTWPTQKLRRERQDTKSVIYWPTKALSSRLLWLQKRFIHCFLHDGHWRLGISLHKQMHHHWRKPARQAPIHWPSFATSKMVR